MDYLTAIDEKIGKLREQIKELETTKRVLLALPKAEKKEKKTRIRSIDNAHQKARAAALAYLDGQSEPKASRDIIRALNHLKVADSTMWKALKELRDEGQIQWDEETRYYTIVREERGTISDHYKAVAS